MRHIASRLTPGAATSGRRSKQSLVLARSTSSRRKYRREHLGLIIPGGRDGDVAISNGSAWLTRLARANRSGAATDFLPRSGARSPSSSSVLRGSLLPISDILMPANALERSERGPRIRNVLDNCHDVCGRYDFPSSVIRWVLSRRSTVNVWPARGPLEIVPI